MPPSAAALVLLCCGEPHQIAALQAAAAEPLARALDLNLQPNLDNLDNLEQLPAGSLVALPLDPGQPRPLQGHWAEQLGATQQCAVLLFDAEQAAGGLPAAASALLLQWRVPLVGLVQWGTPWDGAARGGDGLPWLGWLDGTTATAEAAVALALATRLRWQRLRSELA